MHEPCQTENDVTDRAESFFDTYCGPAPVPQDIWASWNFDPWLVGALVAAWAIWRQTGRRDRTGTHCFRAAGLLAILAFISPLCALSAALFSARVVHHLILIGGVAPLLAIALPWRRGPSLFLSLAAVLHAVVVWSWHAPAPYVFALSSDPAYWFMQVTLLLSAWLFWREVFAKQANTGATVVALLGTIMQMGLLGALLVFAPQPLFAPHLATTLAFGITPLADQQLAGLFMWVPAFLPYAGVAIAQVSAMLAAGSRDRSAPAYTDGGSDSRA